ncbi:MAG: hypothetical protein AAFR90_13200 [Pseudomonadota bacterium]
MPQIVIASCRAYPELSKSNQTLANALENSGANVTSHPWNACDQQPFADADLIFLRQTWDYIDDPGGFASWIIWRQRAGAKILNAPDLAIWNNDKRSLTTLPDLGIPVPITIPIHTEELGGLSDIPTEKIVIKPAFGGSGIGVELATKSTFEDVMGKLKAQYPGRRWFAQEYLPEISNGEWKLTCFDGKAQFAAHLIPQAGEFRVNTRFKPQTIIASPPLSAARAAESVSSWLGCDALCFRIDGVMRNDQFICTELELTDPDLHFHLADAVWSKRLAASILKSL